jgi:hypothetical protein
MQNGGTYRNARRPRLPPLVAGARLVARSGCSVLGASVSLVSGGGRPGPPRPPAPPRAPRGSQWPPVSPVAPCGSLRPPVAAWGASGPCGLSRLPAVSRGLPGPLRCSCPPPRPPVAPVASCGWFSPPLVGCWPCTLAFGRPSGPWTHSQACTLLLSLSWRLVVARAASCGPGSRLTAESLDSLSCGPAAGPSCG